MRKIGQIVKECLYHFDKNGELLSEEAMQRVQYTVVRHLQVLHILLIMKKYRKSDLA